MSTFLIGIRPPYLRGRDRHDILVFTWEDRMEDWVIIWHPMLFEDEIGHPIERVAMEDQYSFRAGESKIRIVLMEHTLSTRAGMFGERQ